MTRRTALKSSRSTEPVATVGDAPEDFVPSNAEEMAWCLKSWRWRLFSGQLYKIMTKADEFNDGQIIPFKPNAAQRRFVENLHYRNVILKARQLGFTTLIAIMWLDHALFVANQRVGIIAQSLEDAGVIFRDKVKFAYDKLPGQVKAMFPLKRESASELVFKHNNSAIRVATSMRSGTIHRLHISEMGKIAAKYPQKAVEIVTGSIPAVPAHGVAVIESTAEGKEGEFFKIATRAEARAKLSRPLGIKEWRFHFFPWHIMPEYRAPANDNTPISAKQHEYFDGVERLTGCKLNIHQRRWYIAELENSQSGDHEKMWREYPSTPGECWQRSIEGTYFAPQLARCRAEGRISRVPFVSNVPVHTFWDIGSGDGTAIWLMQYVGAICRFPLFIENWAQGYSWYVNELRQTGQVFGRHYLPHDADHERQMAQKVGKPIDMLRDLAPDWTFEIVPRVQTKQHGIDLLRGKFQEAMFDEEGCKEGINHIELYHKKWNSRLGMWSEEPEKQDGHSEAADALMQWAQGFDPATALINQQAAIKRIRSRKRSGGMVS
jgi:hypothetical protein